METDENLNVVTLDQLDERITELEAAKADGLKRFLGVLFCIAVIIWIVFWSHSNASQRALDKEKLDYEAYSATRNVQEGEKAARKMEEREAANRAMKEHQFNVMVELCKKALMSPTGGCNLGKLGFNEGGESSNAGFGSNVSGLRVPTR